jgi:hypothetical protein
MRGYSTNQLSDPLSPVQRADNSASPSETNGAPVHSACHVGHSYSRESFVSAQGESSPGTAFARSRNAPIYSSG